MITQCSKEGEIGQAREAVIWVTWFQSGKCEQNQKRLSASNSQIVQNKHQIVHASSLANTQPVVLFYAPCAVKTLPQDSASPREIENLPLI